MNFECEICRVITRDLRTTPNCVYTHAMSRPPASLRALAVARGDEPADLLITGGRVLSPITREWVLTDLAIADGVVAGCWCSR